MADIWDVTFATRASRECKKMPKKIQVLIDFLAKEIEEAGPYRKNWSHYGPLKKDKTIPANAYHCHLKDGKPTYVACWCIDKKHKKVEIFYVGTHENAPY